jgi:hypothetical protein
MSFIGAMHWPGMSTRTDAVGVAKIFFLLRQEIFLVNLYKSLPANRAYNPNILLNSVLDSSATHKKFALNPEPDGAWIRKELNGVQS